MRLSVMVFGLVCVCALVIGTAAPVVQDDEDVRGRVPDLAAEG